MTTSRPVASPLVRFSVVLAMAFGLSLDALAQPAGPGGPGDDRRGPGRRAQPTLTVTGRGEVSIDPDQAEVRLGVVAQADEAAAAQEQVNQTMQQVLQAVRDAGIDEEQIRTEELSLSPVYSQPRPRPVQRADEPQEPVITGYRASNVVRVEVDDLSKVGDVIDAGIAAGANQLESLSFGVEDDTDARQDALRRAVEDARAQADAISAALGMRIEGIAEVVSGGYGIRPPQPYMGQRLAMAEMAGTPVQPGQVDVSGTVTVTYELVPDDQADDDGN